MLLKTLDRAIADGDTVHCLILGSAVNNDGAADGLTVPDAGAQREVVALAHRAAGVTPSDIRYVELHGTGTKVGDPVEAAALGAAIGTARPAGSPLLVGSAKTNVGHLEGAAGIVGLLKTVLAVRHGEIPASLNFESPNPEIPLDALNLRVRTEHGPWPEGRRLAGVSSFGMGGTNCHVVVAEYAPRKHATRATPLTAYRPSCCPESHLRRSARKLNDCAHGSISGRMGTPPISAGPWFQPARISTTAPFLWTPLVCRRWRPVR
ncbi:polyketide synthase [Streptomyces sp. M19]